MNDTPVDVQYRQIQMMIDHFQSSGEVSLSTSASESFRKVLLLSVASYFEFRIKDLVLEFVGERANADTAILSIVRAKAVERQYHTYFDWEGKNANKFFSLFGAPFSNYMQGIVRSDEGLNQAIRAFLELGNLRNQLVHTNFTTFPLEKTVEEIFQLYKTAETFVDLLPQRLRENCNPDPLLSS